MDWYILFEAIVTVALAFCWWALMRVRKVFEYRSKLLNRVHAAYHADLARGREWEWRYDMFESVSNAEMIFKLWRPIDSFYPDKSFIEVE